MKKHFAVLFGAVIIIITAGFWGSRIIYSDSQRSLAAAKKMMQVTSPSFSNGESIPVKFTCEGESASPALSFHDVPEGTKSLTVIVDDPDAVGGTFTHWIMWNISPDTREIAEKSVPIGAVEGKNSGGRIGYTGPCPPAGTHRYFFRVYALDTKIDLGEDSQKADLEKAMEGHILGEGELVGKFSK